MPKSRRWTGYSSDSAELRARRLSAGWYVYFIQAEDGGPVKIGRSKNPTERLKALQTASPKRLVIRRLQSMHYHESLKVEKGLHRRYAEARLDGEWFRPIPELATLARAIPEVEDGFDRLARAVGI